MTNRDRPDTHEPPDSWGTNRRNGERGNHTRADPLLHPAPVPREAAMPDQHLPGAELHLLDDAPMNGDGGARVIWHITWDKNATAAAPADLVPFDNLVGYFTGSGSGEAPHLIWNPFTGRIAQLFSATSRSKSVINAPGGVETNRKGDICIQIETLFFPYCRVDGHVYATVADTPCVGLDRIMAWLRSWGVPDVWPMGPPDWNSHRDAHIWDTQPGHYGHSQIPENDHTDPGPMPALFTPHIQEDDMPSAQEVAVAVALEPVLREYDAQGHPLPDRTASLSDYLGGLQLANGRIEATLAKLQAALTAQAAAIQSLAAQLGQIHGVDTAAVVAAVQQAIRDAVVDVDVTVHDLPKGS
ncbi:hypothetical protein GCM10010440_08300 [Kitasatospora cinereorecta]